VALEASSYIALDEGRLLVHPDFLGLLSSYGLDSFDSLFAARLGKLLREVAGRGNVRLDLPEGTFFLKRHNPETFAHWLRHLFLLRKASSPGRCEFRNCLALQRVGIGSALPVAFGEEKRGLRYSRSLILSAKISGAEPLDDYLKRNFPLRLSAADSCMER